jgi:phosphatidate cytidylyltransferase
LSSELAKRVAFAVVAAPVAVALVFFGGLPLALLLAVVAALGAWELFRIARAGGVTPLAPAGIAAAAALPLLTHARFVLLSRSGGVNEVSPLAPAFAALGRTLAGSLGTAAAAGAAVLLGLLTASIWARGVDGRPLSAVAVTVFGALYTGGLLSFGYAIRYHDYVVGAAAGGALLALPVLLTWASDVGGYAFGRLFGKRKLIPAVSAGKTVAGAVGGLATSAVVCWVYADLVLRPVAQLTLPPARALFFGVVLSVAAQVGDLAESLLKREAGVKDSSRIIPGHGGILDRCDSLFFVLPIAYLLLGPLVGFAPR